MRISLQIFPLNFEMSISATHPKLYTWDRGLDTRLFICNMIAVAPYCEPLETRGLVSSGFLGRAQNEKNIVTLWIAHWVNSGTLRRIIYFIY